MESGDFKGYTVILEEQAENDPQGFSEVPLPPSAKRSTPKENQIPERLREMKHLYQYGSNSFQQKCRNFYRQGKFMEDYEDDYPWHGEYKQYFTTYHDLTVKQLRGYFSWRTLIRKGEFRPITTSFAYMYLYELLNGIGAGSAAECLQKMEEFKAGYLDSGIGDPGMKKNLDRWMFEFAVLHQVPNEMAVKFADPDMIRRDQALAALKMPDDHSDEEVFSALCEFTGSRLESSPVLSPDENRGKHLFSEIWRTASRSFQKNGSNLFTACFGEQKVYPFRPLANAVYLERRRIDEADYIVNECRSIRCRNGAWREERYEKLFFDRKRFQGLFHEADCLLRRYLQTGRYLQTKPENAWADPYINLVIEADKMVQIKAARPKIRIDLSGLEQIRQDAEATRDSLLTGEEAAEFIQTKQEKEDEFLNANWKDDLFLQEDDLTETMNRTEPKEPEEPERFEEPGSYEDNDGQLQITLGLDPVYIQILRALLNGDAPDEMIKSRHLMPSIVADRVNEAFFDEIGDMVLECDGDELSLVEDYTEDVLQILNG